VGAAGVPAPAALLAEEPEPTFSAAEFAAKSAHEARIVDTSTTKLTLQNTLQLPNLHNSTQPNSISSPTKSKSTQKINPEQTNTSK
jgi:hypothetical protein